ncbi:hypothetical protein [Clostridium sp.]|uniref:YfjL-like protein n=1 Tax=Clostridium sp. TaxID=1506 RepID=UPI003D6D7354
MKSKKGLTFKIISGIIALTLIGFILLITNATVGNPITKAMANKAIKQYADKNYPSMDLEIEDAYYEFKSTSYIGIAKSKTSIDTKFGVYYKNGKVHYDDYESRVLGLFNTRQRIEDEYSAIAKNIISKDLRYEKNTTIMDSKSDKGEESMLPLTLDMKFEKDLFLTSNVSIRLDSKENSMEAMAKILTDAHKAFVKNNCNFRSYSLWVQNSSTKYVYISGVTLDDIESSNLTALLEKAKTNRSGGELSVLVH